MGSDVLSRIVEHSISLDNAASLIYNRLAQCAESEELKAFWGKIAKDNEHLLLYWNRLLSFAGKGMLDNVFPDSRMVLKELEALVHKVKDLADQCENICEMEKAFTFAFKLEFYLLHPAFDVLSRYMSALFEDSSREIRYERFVNRLFDALNHWGLASMELELVGETIHRLWKENRRMAFLSHFDELTGILNRRGLFNAMNHLSHLAQRNANTVGVLMIDIDFFKRINDRFGHLEGDKVLQQVAETIRNGVRVSDAVGRYGGEEFLVFLSKVDAGSMWEVGDKIRKLITNMKTGTSPITVSIGAAWGTIGRNVDADLKELIKKADEKLYRAKEEGRNKIVV